MLVQPCLNLCHNEYSNDHRDDMSLIAMALYMEEQDVPCRDLAVRHAEECVDRVRAADIPSVQQ